MGKKYVILVFSFLLATIDLAYSQVTIGGDKQPDENAVLELLSKDSLGLLLPRIKLISVDEADPLSAHEAGMVVYNIGDSLDASYTMPEGYYYNDGNQWILITDTNIASWRSISTKDAATSNTEDIYQSGAVVVGSESLEPKTQFAVVSTTKGVLLPKLTTRQRNDMKGLDPSGTIPDGLLIYNVDTHCYNYYNTNAGTDGEWVSLCGTLDPAIYEFTDCTSSYTPDPISSPQGYKVGVPLTEDYTYRINVRVTRAGTYNILLTTGNGYSFSKSGTFTEAGVVTTVILEGQGAPLMANAAGDIPVAQFNGKVVTPPCDLTRIIVTGTEAQYTYDCGTIAPGPGSYIRGEVVNPAQHYIDVAVNVTNDGRETLQAESVTVSNGLTFRSDPVDLSIGDTPKTVRLYASGVPTNTGTYTYRLGICDFTVTIGSDLGSFKNPAKNCLELLNDDPTRTDGEYWVQKRAGSRDAVKTLCDMSNGGYTLLWSYSENTLRQTYAPTGSMSMYGAAMALNNNKPQNEVVTESGTINYYNHRLSYSTMQNLKQSASSPSEYKVRIAYDPKDVNDQWGKENYFIVKPKSATYDYIASSRGNNYEWTGRNVTTEGKLFNQDYNQTANSNTVVYGGSTYSRNIAALYYGRTPYGNHWDMGARITGRPSSTITRQDGGPMTVTVPANRFNNIFGAISETDVNHHIGKCGQGSDDYSFGTENCSPGNKYPHSFNGGEGRVVQWWVK